MNAPVRGLDADAAVEELYAAHWRSLVRLSVLLVRDQGTAEEVIQDAFVAMHGRWRRLREPDKALAYLRPTRSEEHKSELQSLMRLSYAVCCLKKKNKHKHEQTTNNHQTASR